MNTDVVLGIDLGGTKLATALFNADGKILGKEIVPLGQRSGAKVGKLIQQQIEQSFRVAGNEGLNIRAIGVSVPGISHQKTGRVWAPNISGWENYPLRAQILSAVNDRHFPVQIEGDRGCYILGEVWQGAAQKCQNAIFLAVGTGIGAGILVDGKILRGANDISGAIGWMALQKPFRPEYVSCGCFEHHASGAGLVKMTKELIALDKNYSGVLKAKKQFATAEIFSAYEKGDAIARKVFDQAIESCGMAVANLVSLLNPEMIIFGGGVFGPAAQFLPRIFNEARKWAQPVSIKKVTLKISKLGSDAGVYGAAYLALQTVRAKPSGHLPHPKQAKA